MDPPVADAHRGLAHRPQDAFGGETALVFVATAEHHAETVAADPADDVGGAQALVEAPGDLEQHRVGQTKQILF